MKKLSSGDGRGYRFRLVNIDCLPSSTRLNVIMELDESIEELLPYLASYLPGCTYLHEARVINTMDSGHIVAIYPEKITFTGVRDERQASWFCQKYFDMIHYVKLHKEQLKPVFERKNGPTILEIYSVLPKTNCRECGSPTCMAFAASVFRRESSISACRRLDRNKCRKFLEELKRSGFLIDGS